MPNETSTDTTYHWHSHEHGYVAANRAFIDAQSLAHVTRYLDIACGDGACSEMLLDRSPAAQLNGVDIDPVQIELISERFRKLGYEVRHGTGLTDERIGGKPVLMFAVGTVEALPFDERAFDCVTITNAIHLVPDKELFVAKVSSLLKPGGLFGFNSVFYAGTICDGTHEFYTEWLKNALAYVDGLNARRREAGEPEIQRQRGKGRKAFQNVWLSPDDWRETLARNGIHVHHLVEREMMLDAEFFASAGAYGGLAEVLLSGWPVGVASEALGATAAAAMDTMKQTHLPRKWLEVWATKEGAA